MWDEIWHKQQCVNCSNYTDNLEKEGKGDCDEHEQEVSKTDGEYCGEFEDA